MGRTVVICLVLALAACGGAEADPDAEIQAAIEDYLAGRTNLALDNMTVTLDTVEIEGDVAQAGVTIAASDNADAKMQMAYELQRRSGRWRVKAPESAGGDPHGGTPPPAAGGTLPPGHPPTNAPSTDLPQGHPPIEGGQTVPDPNVPM